MCLFVGKHGVAQTSHGLRVTVRIRPASSATESAWPEQTMSVGTPSKTGFRSTPELLLDLLGLSVYRWFGTLGESLPPA